MVIWYHTAVNVFLGGLQAWEERTALTEIDYIIHYSLDQSKPILDTYFPNKSHVPCYCRYYSIFG